MGSFLSDAPTVPCQCEGHPLASEGCICPPDERFLRYVKAGHGALTDEQRERCLDEIATVEGYERSDYEGDTDAGIAGGVISAWIDYCRDKGLL